MLKPLYILPILFLLCGCDKSPEQTLPEENIYIPQNLDECFSELERILKPADIRKMKNGTEGDMIGYHFGLGMWMRNNWGLWKHSRLAQWFENKGVSHPDEMSGIILTSFWRHLNKKPIELDKQISFLQNFRREQPAE